MAHAPLGRLPTPDDVAQAVLFLASGAAASITGHILADGRHQCKMRLDGEHVLGDVGRTAERVAALADAHHRDRGFRRDPLDVASQVHVQHGIAHDDHAAATSGREQRREARRQGTTSGAGSPCRIATAQLT
jgi:hypothetical protein